MPKYLIERHMPGAGALSETNSQVLAEKSCSALAELGHKFSGWKVSSPPTRCTAFILRRMND